MAVCRNLSTLFVDNNDIGDLYMFMERSLEDWLYSKSMLTWLAEYKKLWLSEATKLNFAKSVYFVGHNTETAPSTIEHRTF